MNRPGFRALHRLAVALLVVCAAVVTVPVPAGAVTYGSVVAAPSRTIPWLLPLYYSSNGTTDAGFICSSSALSSGAVLTAAHCVQQPGFYYVLVGADTLSGGQLVPVEAVNDNPKFSLRRMVNDAALLRPLMPLELSSYARLAPAQVSRRITSGRPPTLKIIGWGRNQNKRVTGRLQAATVTPQSQVAQALFGSTFRPGLMVAAGRYLRKSRAYAGACSGDSGGPLVAVVGRTQYVAGITSWGARSCNAKAPTVFTNVSAYRSWIKAAQRALPRLAATENRALPWNLVDPTLSGVAALGSVLSCDPGAWTRNLTDVRTSWLRAGAEVATSDSYTITAADAGQSLTCEITASSMAGSQTVASEPMALPAGPDGFQAPTIGGILSGQRPAPGTVATCSAPSYDEPVTSVSYSWSSSAAPATPGTVLGSGPTLVLTDEILLATSGQYLVCTTTTANAMGSDIVSAGMFVSRA